VENGFCKPNMTNKGGCCADGQAVFQWGVCSPACSDGVQYFDTNRKRCGACQTGWYPVYESTQSSVGKCEECPWGHTYSTSSKKCVPLNCGIGYVNPRSPHTCAVCPPGQIYSAQTKACECTEGAIKTAGGCACPEGASKILSSATFTCACPQGSSLNKAKSACVCKAGHTIQAVNVGGSIITSCVPNKRAPVQSVRPTAPSTRCPAGTQLIGEACAPIVRRPVQQIPPCPRGTVSTPSGCAPPTRGPAIAQPPAFPAPMPSTRVPQQRQPSSPRVPVPRSEPFGPSIMVPR
jgi:hypothetical protein